jgi:hypothetical protein
VTPVDAEGQALVGDGGVGEELIRRADAANRVEPAQRSGQEVQRLDRGARGGTRAVERGALRLVRRIQHCGHLRVAAPADHHNPVSAARRAIGLAARPVPGQRVSVIVMARG